MSPAQPLPGSFCQDPEISPGQANSRQSSGEPVSGDTGDVETARQKISVNVSYVLDVEPESKSANALVPMFTLGSTYVLTKADAR